MFLKDPGGEGKEWPYEDSPNLPNIKSSIKIEGNDENWSSGRVDFTLTSLQRQIYLGKPREQRDIDAGDNTNDRRRPIRQG